MKNLITLLLCVFLVASVNAQGKKAKNEKAKNEKTETVAKVDDATITKNVKEKLATTGSLKDAAITVETKDGVVTLTGSVKTGQLKGVATNVTKSVEGVKSVDNKLSVEGSSNNADATLAKDVKDKLAATESLKDSKIDAEAKDGVVTLKGSTKTGQLKGVATNVVKSVKGVKKVENQLSVEGKK